MAKVKGLRPQSRGYRIFSIIKDRVGKVVRAVAVCWLIFVTAFAWGASTVKFHFFPYQIFKDLADFSKGDANESTSVVQKLKNDVGLTPERFLYQYDHEIIGTQLAPIKIDGLKDRREAPLVFLSPQAPRMYRLLFGAFDFEEAFWGAILLGPDGNVVRKWNLSTEGLPGNLRPDEQKNLYGQAILPDGSIVFLMQEEGGGIVRVDSCGKSIWVRDGIFHHAITPDHRGGLWTFEGAQKDLDHVLERIDVETGELLDRIDMKDVRSKNPKIQIFDLQRFPEVADRSHGNDVEALTEERAAAFPNFEVGDLVVSYRTPSMVFVIDPDTLKVKWWRIGAWHSQHDPDWDEDGRLTVFSNNSSELSGFSDIISIDPKTYEAEVVIDGADYNFFSGINGNQERTLDGGLLITSSTQGRFFEVNSDGEIVFEFVNSYDGSAKRTLHVGAAYALPLDFFDGPLLDCE